VKIEAIELRQLEIPMVEPLAAAHGITHNRLTVLVHVITDIGEGWGECVALNEPTYSSDYSNGEYNVMREIFGPELLALENLNTESAITTLAHYRGHNPAKAAIELALLDAELRAKSISYKQHLGVTEDEVECCVVLGLSSSDVLLRLAEEKVANGYRHVKLKVQPGHDVERIKLLQEHFPALSIRVDGNGSYDVSNTEHRNALVAMDALGIEMIEQPSSDSNYLDAVELRTFMRTKVAIDEAITSYMRGATILALNICDVMVIKPGMIGGYDDARKLYEACVAAGVETAFGGMVETGLASSANLALAGLPGFSHPAEIAPDGRWFAERVNKEPIRLVDGKIAIPDRPGLGVTIDYGVVNKLTRRMHVLRRS